MTPAIPKYKAGQVLIYQAAKKTIPVIVREVVIEPDGEIFYAIDRKNCLHEPMLRALNDAEIGSPPAPVAEPEKEWRVYTSPSNLSHSTRLRSLAENAKALYGGTLQFSIDGGKTWQDADTKKRL